jgi:hypothetical protein
MELTMELACLAAGVVVGYGSPHTLTRFSPRMDREATEDTEGKGGRNTEGGESQSGDAGSNDGAKTRQGQRAEDDAGGREPSGGDGKRACADVGDAEALRPTFMMVAPAVVDKLMSSVEQKVAQQGPVGRAIFRLALAAGRLNWRLGGIGAPWLLNRLAFQPVQEMMGGRLRFVGSGAAPLSPHAQVWTQL